MTTNAKAVVIKMIPPGEAIGALLSEGLRAFRARRERYRASE